MPADIEEFLRGIAILAENQNVMFTMKQSAKGAAICGAMCFIGGLLAGPVGLAVGGALGGVTAHKVTGRFRSLGDIISNDLSVREKEELYEHVVNSVRQIHPTDAVLLLPMIMNNGSLQQAVIKSVIEFVTNEMRYAVANNM